jgi:hypothetical protein
MILAGHKPAPGRPRPRRRFLDSLVVVEQKQSSLEVQVERLQIDNMLRAGNDDAAAGCSHGYSPLPWGNFCHKFVELYIKTHNDTIPLRVGPGQRFNAALVATF